MPESNEKKQSVDILGSIGKSADKVVGDLVLGSIGRATRLAVEIPGVGNVAMYIGENIKDGYQIEDRKITIRASAKMLIEVCEKAKVGECTPDPDIFREHLLKAGTPEELVDEIVVHARKKMGFTNDEPEQEQTSDEDESHAVPVPLPA